MTRENDKYKRALIYLSSQDFRLIWPNDLRSIRATNPYIDMSLFRHLKHFNTQRKIKL